MKATRHIFGISALFLILLSSSCSVTKYLGNDEILLSKNNIKFENKEHPVDVSDLKSLIKPKPNKRFLIFNLKVWSYYKNLRKPNKFNAWLNRNFGEAPSLFFREDADKSSKKIQHYLADIGFIHSKVNYKVQIRTKKAYVTYTVDLAKPYRIDTIRYEIPDTAIRHFVMKSIDKSLIKKGDIYNAYTLDDERDRITSVLRNNGYFYFNRNYIQFVIDSNLNKQRRMEVKMHIFNRNELSGRKSLPHIRYFIKNVYITPNYSPLDNRYDSIVHIIKFPDDTTSYRYSFLCNPRKMFHPSTFNQSIKIKPGKPYSAKDVQETYRRLFKYSILSTANILFDTTGAGYGPAKNSRYMNSRIEMQTGKLNRFSIEAVGTNSSGDLGIRGNVVYMNKNFLKGAEVLRVSLLGGFEAQKLSNPSDSTGQQVKPSLFNTFEAGLDATIFFPRFVSLFKLTKFNLKYNPQTNMNIGFNYQLRPYYSRNIFNLGLGYSWNQNKFIKHLFTPVNINYVNVNPTPEFEKILENETNRRLKEQYSDHMIFGLKYSIIFNNQQQNRQGHFNYIRLNMESSGNLLYLTDILTNARKSDEGYYNFLGVRYSQYIRFDIDYRHYYYFSGNGNALVFRGVIGTGLPYLNSNDIPYEKGFYSGGANGMRGWRFRTLGPGGFEGSGDYERVGDIQLEANAEFRFPVYKYFKSAFFVDIGNIWTYRETESFPGGSFRFNSFYKQLALDAGMGLRFDFSYFIFRLDFAAPIVNPAFPEGERNRIFFLQFKDIVGNFGIGYPF